MQRNLITAVLLYFACLLVINGFSQETAAEKKRVESVNGTFYFQVGIPSRAMQKAIKNDMGNLGFGAGLEVLTNPFTWGKNADKAVHNSAVLEFIAKTALFTEQINPSAPRLKDSIRQKHFERKHGPDSYYGQ